MQADTLADKIDELISKTRRSLVAVGVFFYPEAFSLKPSPLHYKLSDALIVSKESTAMALPRELGKTTYVWEIMATWNILHRRFRYIVYIASSLDKGKKSFRNVKACIKGHPLVSAMFTVDRTGDTADKLIYEMDGEIYMIAVFGANQNLRGEKFAHYRPDLIILDDIESKEAVRSEDQRDKLMAWFNADIIPLGKEARIFVMGTILHEDSLLNNLITKPPIDAETGKKWVTMKFAVIDDDGNSVWPEKYSDSWIENKRKSLIEQGQQSTWDNEYMNESVSRSSRTFDPRQLRYYNDDQLQSALKAGMDKLLIVDPGIKTEDKHDATAMAVLAMDPLGNIWALDLFCGKVRKSVMLAKIEEFYIKWSPRKVLVEGVQGQNYLIQDLEDGNYGSGYPMNVEEIDSKQIRMGKTRIYNLEPEFTARRILVPFNAPWLLDFQTEIVGFPKGKSDNILDVFSYGKLNLIKMKPILLDTNAILNHVSSTSF